MNHVASHQTVPIPKIVRYRFENDVVTPTTMVDSTCIVCLECASLNHDAPRDGLGFCACGSEWTEEGIIETEQVLAIRKAMVDGCDCG